MEARRIPDREQIADRVKSAIAEVYQARYRYLEHNAFSAMKRAADHVLDDLRSKGQVGLADRLFQEIAHEYHQKHHFQRMPALAAFTKAADEVLEKFADGRIV